jgi:hypothetical protein
MLTPRNGFSAQQAAQMDGHSQSIWRFAFN